ncbi:MAG: DUF2796 domain-containing protein [Gammaproteobacteria bacterium]|nr:DUF2796 domain-containing protein [Gammaproteobacteria bacterium]
MFKPLVSILAFTSLVLSNVSVAHHVSDHKVDDILLTKGHARVIVSVSGSSVEVELYIPTVNMVSFEGEPSDSAQQAEFDSASTWLAEANNALTFSAEAECVAVVSEVNISNIDGKAKADNAALAEFDAYYIFECAKPEELGQVTVNLFEHYPTHKEIFSKRQGIGKTKRGKLSPAENKIGLSE